MIKTDAQMYHSESVKCNDEIYFKKHDTGFGLISH